MGSGVTSAFRLGVLLGHSNYEKHYSIKHRVTSAFRLGVLLGRSKTAVMARVRAWSPVPFGWESCWDKCPAS